MTDHNLNGDEGEMYAGQQDQDYNQTPDGALQDSPGDNMGQPMDDIEYDEMDLTPYEDDDDATLHKKLCAAKVARKRAEEDLKLLCNRIGLLKMEQGKVSITPPHRQALSVAG